jgi:GT2 family glycosyltransferase
MPELSISVIMPTSHRPQLLHQALASLLKQRYLPREIVVAAYKDDTESLDELEGWNARATARNVRLSVIRVGEDSMIARQNAAISAATSDVVAFMDDDAAARPDWLERILANYSSASIGGVGGRDVVWLDGAEYSVPARRVGRVSWYGRLTGNHHNVAPRQEVSFLKGCNMSFRRELVVELDAGLRGPVAYGYEIDLGLSVRARGFRIIYDPDVTVDHYPSSDMNADARAVARTVNHNQTYVLLKRLPLVRRLAFLAYTAAVGDRNTAGAARIPWLMTRGQWSTRAVGAHIGGKVAGLRTYVARRRYQVSGN